MSSFPRPEYNKAYVATNTTTDVHSGKCVLHAIVVGETAGGAITIYDEATGGSSTVAGVLKSGIAEGTYVFNMTMAKGIQVVTAAASKITVLFTTY